MKIGQKNKLQRADMGDLLIYPKILTQLQLAENRRIFSGDYFLVKTMAPWLYCLSHSRKKNLLETAPLSASQ